MRAMGGSRKLISGLFQMEFLIATILAVLMGIIASIPLTDALCTVLTETVIYHYIPACIDLRTTGLTILILLGLQTICIALFNYWKIRGNTRTLLNTRI